MATNFRVKMGEVGRLTVIVALAFRKGLEYRNCDFKRFNADDLATSYKHLVNFGPVALEFKRSNNVHPLVDQQFSHFRLVAPLQELAEISTEFCRAISTQFCFSYLLRASLLCRAGYTLGSATHF